MISSIDADSVERIVGHHHPHPFEVLGPHRLDGQGGNVWVIRAYLPKAQQAWVVLSDHQNLDCRDTDHRDTDHRDTDHRDLSFPCVIPMHPVHHPHFFEGQIDQVTLPPYQLRILEGEEERTIDDAYGCRTSYLTDFDLHLFTEGNHHRIYEKLGAHSLVLNGLRGVHFALWAPNAVSVSVMGDFNQWDERDYPMQLHPQGVWMLFIPGLKVGDRYQFAIRNQVGQVRVKSDPYGFQLDSSNQGISVVTDLDSYVWEDRNWMAQRQTIDPLTQPICLYQVHLDSWKKYRLPSELFRLTDIGYTEATKNIERRGDRPTQHTPSYRELADDLISYVKALGYTHIELLPLTKHSPEEHWSYKTSSYFAGAGYLNSPQDLMYFVNQCHQQEIGVILTWVPGHFAQDSHGLSYFDGTALYEYDDTQRVEHPLGNTFMFDLSRSPVRNFLIANGLFWLDKYHIDGFRVEGVTAMLYLDYGKREGEWRSNAYGGRENIDAVHFLRQFNEVLFHYFPGVLSIAEESTTWPMVSWPTYLGGLGFNLKWNSGWMQNVLDYFRMDPWFRQFHQNNVTFSMWYHQSENFMLTLSHQVVGQGKSGLLGQMSGDRWQKFAHLRCLFSFMYTHPGKKLIFMGMEFGQWREWDITDELDWHLLQLESHQKLHRFFKDLHYLYCHEAALHSQDFAPEGFTWIDYSDSRHSVISFIRRAKNGEDFVITVCNFTPQPHSHYRIGAPEFGFYMELFNSDARHYGGSNMGNLGGKWAEDWPYHSLPYSLDLCLPPLTVLVLKLDRPRTAEAFNQAQQNFSPIP